MQYGPGFMAPGGPMPPYGVPPVPPQLMIPAEESYIENILRMNLGKSVTLHMTYEQNQQWNAMVFKGRLEAAGRDHIIISEPDTGKRYLLLMVNLDYIVFDEPIDYVPLPIPGFLRPRT